MKLVNALESKNVLVKFFAKKVILYSKANYNWYA